MVIGEVVNSVAVVVEICVVGLSVIEVAVFDAVVSDVCAVDVSDIRVVVNVEEVN